MKNRSIRNQTNNARKGRQPKFRTVFIVVSRLGHLAADSKSEGQADDNEKEYPTVLDVMPATSGVSSATVRTTAGGFMDFSHAMPTVLHGNNPSRDVNSPQSAACSSSSEASTSARCTSGIALHMQQVKNRPEKNRVEKTAAARQPRLRRRFMGVPPWWKRIDGSHHSEP